MILAKQMIANLKHLHTSSAPVGNQETDYFSYKPPCNRATTDLGLAKNNATQFTITNASDLEYFSEGSSNVLFRYIGEDFEEELRPRLLRFRKQRSISRTTKQIHDDIKKTFVPLLSSYVVQTDLCSIAPSVIKSLNETLRSKGIQNDDQGDEGYDDSDSDRDDGDLLDEGEEYALVVEDMSPGIYQKHNEIAHGRSIRRSRQFPFLSPKASNASLVSGENSEVNSGYNTDDDEVGHSADEQEDQGYEKKERSRSKDKLPIPKKKDLDPARLSARNWRDLLTVSFRPGCLTQPKSAPAGWSICRDCASRHMGSSFSTTPRMGSADSGLSDCSVDSGNASSSSSSSSAPYCPLDLISPDPSRVHAAIESVISTHRSVKILDEEEVLVNDPALGISGITPWLDVLEYSIVNILADYFWDQGSIGHVLERLQESDREADAEALRKCTLYVRLWMRNQGQDDNYEVHIECKIGGLDNVSSDGKAEEEQLVRGGWYLGRGFHGAICRRE